MSKKFVLIVLTTFFIAALITYLSGDYTSLAVQIWNLTPPFAAALTGILAVKVYGLNNPHARAFGFIALGIFFWFIGDFIWFILEYFFNQNPFPSIADYFYLFAYPLLLIGLIQELRANKMRWTYCKVISCILLSLFFGLIVFYFGIIKAFDSSDLLINNLIAIAYGVGDLLLIIFTVLILMVAIGYQKGKLFYPWLIILIGFFLILVADILFAMYHQEYENLEAISRNIDLGWISGFLFLTYGFYSIEYTVMQARNKLLGN